MSVLKNIIDFGRNKTVGQIFNGVKEIVSISIKDSNGKDIVLYETTDNTGGGYTYSGLEITNLSYDVIPAKGGTVTPTISYRQKRTQTGGSGEIYGSDYINSGATIEYYEGTTKLSSGSITASPKPAVESGETTYKTITVKVSLNGETVSRQYAVKQALNKKTGTGEYNGKTQSCYQMYTEYQITNVYSSGDISASGGSSYATATGQSRKNYYSDSYTKYEIHDIYTSGSHAHNGTYTTKSGWSDGTAPNAGSWGNNTALKLSEVNANSLGTTLSNRAIAGESTITWNDVNAKCNIYQSANKITNIYIMPNDSSKPILYYANSVIPSSGGSVSPTKNVKYNFKFTSGDTTTSTSTTFGGGNLNLNITYAKKTDAFNAFELNSTTGVVSAKSRTNIPGDERSCVVTVSYNATYTHSATYGSTVVNAVTENEDKTIKLSENKLTISGITINSFSYQDVIQSGGTITPSLSYSQTGTYSSGNSYNSSTGATVEYTKDVTWGKLNSATGEFIVPPNTDIDDRYCTVTVTVSRDGKSATSKYTLYQDGGDSDSDARA